jgi:hypothetical protein
MSGAIRKSLLLAALVVSSGVVEGKVANKTYFSARNELQHNGWLWASKAPFKNEKDGKNGISTDALLFASSSTNKLGLGRHFGASLKSDYSDANATVSIGDSSLDLPNGLFDRQVDHTYSVEDTEHAMWGKLQFRPVQKRIGAYLGAHADLGTLCNAQGWHVSVAMPIVRVSNTLGTTYVTSVASAAGDTKSVTAASTLEHLFDGTYGQIGANSQQQLEYGKIIPGTHVRTAVADIKLSVAYDIARDIDGLVQVRGGVIIPVGTKPKAERLFEAVVGNGRHVGVMAGAHGDMQLWENKEKRMAVWISGDAEYTFLFESREKRIAGIYNADADVQATVPFGHMALGVLLNNAGTFPLANVLARDMHVTPGSHFDATMGVSFTWKDFYFNAGYNMFYKKTETVDLADQWPVDRYGMATYEYAANTAATDFTASSLSTAGTDAVGPIAVRYSTATHIDEATVKYQVDTLACTDSNQETHAAVLGLGYRGVIKAIPFTASLVGSYEIAGDSSKAIQGWVLGAQLSMKF